MSVIVAPSGAAPCWQNSQGPTSVRRTPSRISRRCRAAAEGQKEADDLQFAGDLASQVHTIRDRAASLLRQAETAGNIRTALAACRELCRCVELLGRFAGDRQDGGSGSAGMVMIYSARRLQTDGLTISGSSAARPAAPL